MTSAADGGGGTQKVVGERCIISAEITEIFCRNCWPKLLDDTFRPIWPKISVGIPQFLAQMCEVLVI